MIFSYLVPILLILLVYQFVKQKRSIKNKDYDYRYYEEGPYGERKQRTWIDKIKDWFPFSCFLVFNCICMQSCRPDPQPLSKQYPTGYFCVNEGIFGQTSGTVSHFDPNTKVSTDQIFASVNDRPLGNVVQSIAFTNELAFIVVNNSNKIELVNALNFESISQIAPLQQPRYVTFNSDDIAYVSQWGDNGISGRISKVNIPSRLIVQTELIGTGPEKMAHSNNRLYVPLSGGYQTNNKIVILNDQTLECTDSIEVNDRPLSCQIDQNGSLWVLCAGKTVYATYPNVDTSSSTPAAIIQIDTSTKNTMMKIEMEKGLSLSNLILNLDQNEVNYLKNGAIYQYNTLTNQEVEIANNGFYGLGYDPATDRLLGAINNGINPSKVVLFSGQSAVDSFDVGTFPNSIIVR